MLGFCFLRQWKGKIKGWKGKHKQICPTQCLSCKSCSNHWYEEDKVVLLVFFLHAKKVEGKDLKEEVKKTNTTKGQGRAGWTWPAKKWWALWFCMLASLYIYNRALCPQMPLRGRTWMCQVKLPADIHMQTLNSHAHVVWDHLQWECFGCCGVQDWLIVICKPAQRDLHVTSLLERTSAAAKSDS